MTSSSFPASSGRPVSPAKPAVYLAGPIAHMTYAEASEWRQKAHQVFEKEGMEVLDPMSGCESLENHQGPLGDVTPPGMTIWQVFEEDKRKIRSADLVLAYINSNKVSIGTVWEIGHADALEVPVILIVSENVDWVKHPSLQFSSCTIVLKEGESLDDSHLKKAFDTYYQGE